MFCRICREGKLITAKGSEKTNALIAGTDNIKLETIKLHEYEGTRQHRSASKDKKNKKKTTKKQRHACVEISSRKGVDVIKQNKAKQVRVKRCMCNTHANETHKAVHGLCLVESLHLCPFCCHIFTATLLISSCY